MEAGGTMKVVLHFLNCAATHPDAEKLRKASDMILPVGGDAACSVAFPSQKPGGRMFTKGPGVVIAKIIKNADLWNWICLLFVNDRLKEVRG